MAPRATPRLIAKLRPPEVTISLTPHRLKGPKRPSNRPQPPHHPSDHRPPQRTSPPPFPEAPLVQNPAPPTRPHPPVRRPPARQGRPPKRLGQNRVHISGPRDPAPAVTPPPVQDGGTAPQHRITTPPPGRPPPADPPGRPREGGPDNSATPIRPMIHQEPPQYYRSGSIIATTATLPIIFAVEPPIQNINPPASSAATLPGKDPCCSTSASPPRSPPHRRRNLLSARVNKGLPRPPPTPPHREEGPPPGRAPALSPPPHQIVYGLPAQRPQRLAVLASSPVASAALRAPAGGAGVVPAVAGGLINLRVGAPLPPLQ